MIIGPAGSRSANSADPLIFLGGVTAAQTSGVANSANSANPELTTCWFGSFARSVIRMMSPSDQRPGTRCATGATVLLMARPCAIACSALVAALTCTVAHGTPVPLCSSASAVVPVPSRGRLREAAQGDHGPGVRHGGVPVAVHLHIDERLDDARQVVLPARIRLCPLLHQQGGAGGDDVAGPHHPPALLRPVGAPAQARTLQAVPIAQPDPARPHHPA